MKQRINRTLEVFLVTLMITMVFNVLWQVASRYLLNNPSSFTDELARYLLIWIGFLGAAYGTGKHIHLAIDLLPAKIRNPAWQQLHRKIVNGLIALFALLVMVVGGLRLVYVTLILDQRSSALDIPLGIVYLAIPLSGLIILFYTLGEIVGRDKDLSSVNTG
jgi:TRAP-type C4-dicarboxylate transport system permease small subunit